MIAFFFFRFLLFFRFFLRKKNAQKKAILTPPPPRIPPARSQVPAARRLDPLLGMSGPAECAGLFPLSPALFPLVLAFLVAIACWFHCFPGFLLVFFLSFFCFFKSPFLAFFPIAFFSFCSSVFFCFFCFFKSLVFVFFALKKNRFTGVSLYSRHHKTKVCLFLEICKGGTWIFSAKMVYKVFRGFCVQVTKQDAICRVSKPLLERLDIFKSATKTSMFVSGFHLDPDWPKVVPKNAKLVPNCIPTGSQLDPWIGKYPLPHLFSPPHPPLPLFSFSAHQPCTNTPLLLHQNGISQMGVLQSPN